MFVYFFQHPVKTNIGNEMPFSQLNCLESNSQHKWLDFIKLPPEEGETMYCVRTKSYFSNKKCIRVQYWFTYSGSIILVGII